MKLFSGTGELPPRRSAPWTYTWSRQGAAPGGLRAKGPWARAVGGLVCGGADSGIPEFEKAARTVKKYWALAKNTLDHDVTGALSEVTDTHLRMLAKRAYGLRSPEALIVMAEFALAVPRPLPDRG